VSRAAVLAVFITTTVTTTTAVTTTTTVTTTTDIVLDYLQLSATSSGTEL